MSSYGQNPYGQNPYGPPNPYGPQAPYGQQPGQAPYGPPQPYGQPGQAPYGQPGYGQWTPPPAGRPELVERSIPVVTMEQIPGRKVLEVIGDVVGVVARHRELPRELRGAPVGDAYVSVLTQSRQDAVSKMAEMAAGAGANAVVGLRFDSSEITQSLSEVVAYGTAVRLSPAPAAEIPASRPAETEPETTDSGETLARPLESESGGQPSQPGPPWSPPQWPPPR